MPDQDARKPYLDRDNVPILLYIETVSTSKIQLEIKLHHIHSSTIHTMSSNYANDLEADCGHNEYADGCASCASHDADLSREAV